MPVAYNMQKLELFPMIVRGRVPISHALVVCVFISHHMLRQAYMC